VSLVAVAALVAAPLAGGNAWAKKQKSKIKCTINGETFKTNTLGGGATGGYESVISLVTIIGGRAKIKIGHSVASTREDVRTLGIVINNVPDLTTATFPLTLPAEDTTTNFLKTVTRGLDVAYGDWNGDGVTVTITDFDGTRLQGTAEGTIPWAEGTETPGPATVENCKFSVLPPATP